MKIKLIGNNDYLFNPKNTILQNRGLFDYEELNPNVEDVNSPSLFENIKEGVSLLLESIKNKEKIHIIIDTDCDGSTSASVTYLFLTEVIKYPKHLISYHAHPNKEHGIILSELKDYQYDLLIVPDAGSTDFKSQKAISEEGRKILILDHHNYTKEKIDNVVVINSKDGSYPNSELSGVGVTFQFFRYFCEVNSIAFDFNKYLDLVATGLISDMVDSRIKENRFFINKGLSNINNSFLKNLIQKNLYNKETIINNIAFYIAPYINAIHRIGDIEEKINLFKAFVNDSEPILIKKRGKEPALEYLSEDMVRQATNIKKRQDTERDALVEQIESQINDSPVLMIEMPIDSNRVFFGLLANTLSNRYGKPSIVFAENSNGTFSGSARGYELSGIESFRDFIIDTGLFIRADGHSNAFGTEFNLESLETIKNFFKEKLKSFNDKIYHVDFSLNENEFNNSLIKDLNDLFPYYGQNFKEPYVHIKNLKVYTNEIVINDKRTVLKYSYRDKTYCWFYPNEKVIEQLSKPNQTIILDVVGRCSINNYNNTSTYQMVIEDYLIVEDNTVTNNNDISWF